MIELNNISYEINGTKILDNISFEIKENTLTCIVGPNGAGKTTLIEVISGLRASKNSNVKHDKKVVYVNPDMLIFNFLTAKEYVQMIEKLNNVSANEVAEILKLFSDLKIEDFWNTRLEFLSLGQKQKLLLLIGFISKPDILLFDEPFNALDINAYHFAIKLFKEFKSKFSIFFSSHELIGLSELCDSIIYLEQGKIKKKLIKEDGDLKDDSEFIKLFRIE